MFLAQHVIGQFLLHTSFFYYCHLQRLACATRAKYLNYTSIQSQHVQLPFAADPVVCKRASISDGKHDGNV